MIDIRRKQLVIDGVPRIVLAGEVHYFRLARDEWADRVDKLAAAGCDTVASYIPWLVHELPDGTFDLSGRSRPENDLGAFIDLCASRGMRFLARPGPFVMAELKNEGLPYRVYEEHPEIVPVSWDGSAVSSRTVDYLAPAYLEECARWYAAVMPVLASRLAPAGGPVIAVQLDNEVGMLSWVTNSPDLTDFVLADFVAWLGKRWSAEALAARYPFSMDAPLSEIGSHLRSPGEEWVGAFTQDLGHYQRDRFARYIAALRSFAETSGVTGVPFIVNVHGTSNGRGDTFPIGISQLVDTYRGIPGLVAGTDHYLGELTPRNVTDLYLINAFMDAVNDADQPLTSVEFEAGDGDYGNDLSVVHDPSTVDLKTRLCVAQGNRLINYYIFTGGVNPRLPTLVGDGNDRIGFTGERHGVHAPVGPEGQLNLSYSRTAAVVGAVKAVEPLLATMSEQHDDVALAFVPDYFMTESVYPSSALAKKISDNLSRHRFGGPGQMMARAMLLGGYRFGSVALDRSYARNAPLTPDLVPTLAFGSASYLSREVQVALVEYLQAGGRLLLCGEVPAFDLEGRPCTVLRDALGLVPRSFMHSSHAYFVSVCAAGWAAPRPERRVGYAQGFAASSDAFLVDYQTGDGCGFDLTVGAGRAVVISCDYPGDISLYRSALERLGAPARVRHDASRSSLVVTTTANDAGERFVHALNLDGYPAEFSLTEDGAPLLEGARVSLPGRGAVMLPVGLQVPGGHLAYATAELASFGPDSMSFRPSPGGLVAAFATDRTVVASAGEVSLRNGLQVVSAGAGLVEVQLT